MKAPKKVSTWRTCPHCGGRVTKLFHLSTGKLQCQQCDGEYEPPENKK